jgi:tryptophan synthase alpha chain
MTYYNPVYDYGINMFIRDAKKSGCDGVIVPDLIPEESDEFLKAASKEDFNVIFLAAPTSPKKRLRLISMRSKGFIYYVSLTGVTGARKSLPRHIKEHIRQIKNISKKPVCVGFGVSSPKQVKALSPFCDGVIVGSAIINVLEKHLNKRNAIVPSVRDFVKKLTRALR